MSGAVWIFRSVIKKYKKKLLTTEETIRYNNFCVVRRQKMSGCGSAWLERLVWDQEAAGSNPVTPIMTYHLRV